MMVQLIVETVVFIVVNLVIGQLLSKLHIDQSRGFWKVKITKIILKDLSFKCAFLRICFKVCYAQSHVTISVNSVLLS